jgi:transcriptional regulator with XRE-family HTH domain
MKLSHQEMLVHQQISRNMLKAITRRGLKQEAIAEMLGMRQNHLSEKLHGKHGIQMSFLIKLSFVTGIPMAELIGVPQVDEMIFGKPSDPSKEKQGETSNTRVAEPVEDNGRVIRLTTAFVVSHTNFD